MLEKWNISKYNIIQIIFKYCVSQMYLTVMLSSIKTHIQSDRYDQKIN